ncbi:MAG: type II toxin-antitoxin system VapC family toxin [Verrucomicrobia bacterium]|nr:type II toxin-antitoxin system VapC family toxin [Verrucomicrobiota bacterium]
MVICADTSFLISFYGNDVNTPPAIAWSAVNSEVIYISSLNRFELINALRFAECRKSIAPGNAGLFSSQFETDILGGRLIEKVCNLADVLAEATRLSAAHTLSGGHRGFDILHVAAARIIGATHFLTFDVNQKRLAKAAGLKLPI